MAAMALAPGDEEFDTWLGGKLRDLNMDESVFTSYIKGILNGDESNDEKIEALEGIISEIVEDNISTHCQEILDHWQKVVEAHIQQKSTLVEDVEEKLVKMLGSQTLQTVQQKEYTADEKRIREAILAQYSEVQDEEGYDDDHDEDNDGLQRNTNASAIQQAERERREQAKLESQKKKEKDREDREKQKQLAAEKKEKRKTQKGERRR